MQQKNLFIIISILICSVLLIGFNSKTDGTNDDKYVLKAGTLIEIGKDIPEGTYELNLNKDDHIGYVSLEDSSSEKMEVIDLVRFKFNTGYKGYRKFKSGEKLDLTNTLSDIIIIKQ